MSGPNEEARNQEADKREDYLLEEGLEGSEGGGGGYGHPREEDQDEDQEQDESP